MSHFTWVLSLVSLSVHKQSYIHCSGSISRVTCYHLFTYLKHWTGLHTLSGAFLESPNINHDLCEALAWSMASIGAFLPPSHRNIIQVARKLSGDCWGCSQSMPPAICSCMISFTILFIIAYHSVYILQPSPPHKEANLPSNSKFLLLCCYIRTVIGITVFSVSEFEHLCTLLDAGRLRGKT